MMYPRLFLAKNLLRDDGVIFVHIDDNEVYNLRLIMNEIFGEENFIAEFVWEKRKNRENRKIVSSRHEYILAYAREFTADTIFNLPMTQDALNRYKNPDNDPRGPWKSDPATAQAGHGTKSQFYLLIAPDGKKHSLQSGRCWLYTEDVMKTAIEDNRIWFGIDGNGVPRIKTFLNEKERSLTPESIFFANHVSTNEEAKNALKRLFDGVAIFETPKPVGLVKELIKISTKDGIIFDFFTGSATTAQAVMELNKEDGGNRKFILVQLPEPCDENSEAYKAGYKTIAEIGKERIRRVIRKIEQQQAEEAKKKAGQLDFGDAEEIPPLDLGFKSFRLAPSNFKIWRSDDINEENLEEQLEMFTNPVREGSLEENMLYELMLKAGYQPTDKVQKIGNFYSICNNELIIALESMDEKTAEEILALHPLKVITLDILFKDNDQLKTNTVLQMKDAGVKFKTI